MLQRCTLFDAEAMLFVYDNKRQFFEFYGVLDERVRPNGYLDSAISKAFQYGAPVG